MLKNRKDVRTKIIAFKVTEDEKAKLTKAAKAYGTKLSAFLRIKALGK